MYSPTFTSTPTSPALSDTSSVTSTLSDQDQQDLEDRILHLSHYQQEKNVLLRAFVCLDPQDPFYSRQIRDLKRSIRHAELFICSYQVLVREISERAIESPSL